MSQNLWGSPGFPTVIKLQQKGLTRGYIHSFPILQTVMKPLKPGKLASGAQPSQRVSVASSYCSCQGLGSALFCFLLYWVWWSEWRMSPHTLDIWTLSPQLVASFEDIVESFKVRAILEEVCHWRWELRVISLASLPVHSLRLMVEMWLWTSCSC